MLLRVAIIGVVWSILTAIVRANHDDDDEKVNGKNVVVVEQLKVSPNGLTVEDNGWVMSSSVLILTMQAGFAMLEMGFSRVKNIVNIMLKNVGGLVITGCSFFITGWAFYNSGSNPVVGDSEFLFIGSIMYPQWMMAFAFAATSSIIVSGAMAERTYFRSYLWFTAWMGGWIYPVAARWVWHSNGWLATMGYTDLAGCGPIHMLGGVCGMTGSLILRPRRDKFTKEGKPIEIALSDPGHIVFGTFLLWWGWYGFNAGSTMGLDSGKDILAGKISVNTSVSAVFGGLSAFICCWFEHSGRIDVLYAVNGILGALVGITAAASVVQPWEAMIIGLLCGVVACYGNLITDKLKVDDPVGVFPVHCLCGAMGSFVVGLFAQPVTEVEGSYSGTGLFHGGGMRLLGVQVLGIVVMYVWAIVMSGLMFWILIQTVGLRVDAVEESFGLDAFEHNLLHTHQVLVGLTEMECKVCHAIGCTRHMEDGWIRADLAKLLSCGDIKEVRSLQDLYTVQPTPTMEELDQLDLEAAGKTIGCRPKKYRVAPTLIKSVAQQVVDERSTVISRSRAGSVASLAHMIEKLEHANGGGDHDHTMSAHTITPETVRRTRYDRRPRAHHTYEETRGTVPTHVGGVGGELHQLVKTHSGVTINDNAHAASDAHGGHLSDSDGMQQLRSRGAQSNTDGQQHHSHHHQQQLEESRRSPPSLPGAVKDV